MAYDPTEQLDVLKCGSCGYVFDRSHLDGDFKGECTGIKYRCVGCGVEAAEFVSELNPMCDDEVVDKKNTVLEDFL